MPVAPADGELGYRSCLSSGCCNRIQIEWVADKQHKLIFHSSRGREFKIKATVDSVFGEGPFSR